MARHKPRIALGIAVGVLLLLHPASASRRTIADDTQSSDHERDIGSIVHGHQSDRILRHEIVFDGHPGASVADNVSLLFKLRNEDGDDVRRELVIRRNPGGGLYGAFFTRGGELTGYARAWFAKDDGSTLVVAFPLSALGRPKRDRYRWYAWSFLGAGEFENPCDGEDEGPPTCADRAPAEGAVVHRL